MPYADPIARREYARKWIVQRRAEFFADKKCGTGRTTESLELHHLDPTQKEHHAIWSWSEVRRLAEIAKCVVLCTSCHRSLHAAFRRARAERDNAHGTVRRYWVGCRCEPCRASHREYNRAHPPKKAA